MPTLWWLNVTCRTTHKNNSDYSNYSRNLQYSKPLLRYIANVVLTFTVGLTTLLFVCLASYGFFVLNLRQAADDCVTGHLCSNNIGPIYNYNRLRILSISGNQIQLTKRFKFLQVLQQLVINQNFGLHTRSRNTAN